MVNVTRKSEIIEGVEVEVLEFSDTVENVEKASRLSGEPPNKIVKTLLLKVGEDYVVAVVRGDRKVDYKKASRVLGSSISLAKPKEVLEILGLEPGAVTPLSLKVKTLKVILDPAILDNEYILCGGGGINKLYKVKTASLLQYLNPDIIDIFK